MTDQRDRPPSLSDGARVLLIRHHEDDDLGARVVARVARGRMQRARGLVEHLAGLEQPRRRAVDSELVAALDDVTERVMAGLAVRRAPPLRAPAPPRAAQRPRPR